MILFVALIRIWQLDKKTNGLKELWLELKVMMLL